MRLNKKGFITTNDTIFIAAIFAAIFAVVLSLFWFVIISPSITAPREKQSALSAVQELQDNYNSQSTNLSLCLAKYQNCNNRQYTESLSQQNDFYKKATYILLFAFIFSIALYLLNNWIKKDRIEKQEREIERLKIKHKTRTK